MGRRKREYAEQLRLDFGDHTGGGDCGAPYFPEPASDNERLLNLQHEYLCRKSGEAWAGLWEGAYRMELRLVASIARQHRFRMCGGDLEDYAMSATEYVLRRYKTYRERGMEYVVRKSFVSVLRGGALHALFYKTKADTLVSYVSPDELSHLMAASRRGKEEDDEDDDMP